MRRLLAILALVSCGLLTSHCATEGGGGGDFYGGYYYDDWWYGGGCCVDYPGDIGPHPEHPIAKPPAPAHPIASPPSVSQRPMPSPRPAMRGGGGRR
jgi:hypothetical protein